MNLKEITAINGKKLKKSHVNLLVKLADKFNVTASDVKEVRSNPFTGARKELEPLAVALFDFIVPNYHKGLVKGSTAESMLNPNAIPTQIWDSSRHFFLEYWPEEYFALID